MDDLLTVLRDQRYVGQECMREQAAAEIERLTRELSEWKQAAEVEARARRDFMQERDEALAALEPFAGVPPHSPPERRCIVMDAEDGPYHFLQSDLDRAKSVAHGQPSQHGDGLISDQVAYLHELAEARRAEWKRHADEQTAPEPSEVTVRRMRTEDWPDRQDEQQGDGK